MAFLETLCIVILHIIAWIYDICTYIPYYFIQEPRTVLELSNRQKAVSLTNHPAGPYRCAEESDLTTTPDEECATLDELFQKCVNKYAESSCFGVREFLKCVQDEQKSGKQHLRLELGDYAWMTYREVMEKVMFFGKGLLLTGLKIRENVLIFAETRPEWMIVAQACFRENMPLITLYATLGEDAIVHAVNQTEITYIVTSEDLIKKVSKLLPQMKTVTTIIYMKGRQPVNTEEEFKDDHSIRLFTYDEIVAKGESFDGDMQPLSPPMPRDVAVIMYTSGSTGTPKGVLLSHSNILASSSGIIVRSTIRTSDTYLAYLPLAHILEMVAEISCLHVGMRIGYGSPFTLINNATGLVKGCDGDLAVLQPTMLASVPAILDRVYKGVMEKVKNGSCIRRVLFTFAMSYKRKWLYRGANTPLINVFIMSSIRYTLGGRIRAVLSGGAPISPKTQEFLRLALCCPIQQGYGLTETGCAGTISDQDDLSSGHVGAPLACTHIKLVDWEEGGYTTADVPGPRGEIWIGGPAVGIGYYKDQDKTDEDFHQRGHIRWFATGDIARMRADGTVVIIDRKKDLIKLQTGEYVSLGKVELILRLSPLIDNACIIARPDQYFVVALVVPNTENLQLLAKGLMNIDKTDMESICHDEAVIEEMLTRIKLHAIKNGLMRFEIPQKLHLVTEQWLPDTGLVTASMKLKRRQLSAYYTEAITRMFPRNTISSLSE